MNNSPTVGPMAKISLLLEMRSDKGPHDPEPKKKTFDFCYGIGPEGLSDFEMDLHGRSPGDSLDLRITSGNHAGYFGHLFCPLMETLMASPPYNLHLTIQSVTQATERELVRALADQSGSGGGCDCGCGCSC